jgi:tRNA pseudouridine55 synthase
MTLDGLLLIDKPPGITSHDAVQKVRRRIGQRDIGHTGTLDPMATGLLVLAVGRATRIARFVEDREKRYTGVVRLGRSTATYDAEGDTLEERAIDQIDEIAAAVDGVLARFVGPLVQKVPPYSAVKVRGERLYAKARRGEELGDLPEREVVVHSLRATRVAPPDIEIDTTVSKGTYIRTLAVQIGAALGLPAHLASLRRISVGDFRVEDASGVDGPFTPIPIERAVAHLPALELDAARADDVRFGRPIGAVPGFVGGDPVRVIGPGGELLAIAFAAAPEFRYACVLAARSR